MSRPVVHVAIPSGLPGHPCPGCMKPLAAGGRNAHGQRTVKCENWACDWVGVDVRDLRVPPAADACGICGGEPGRHDPEFVFPGKPGYVAHAYKPAGGSAG